MLAMNNSEMVRTVAQFLGYPVAQVKAVIDTVYATAGNALSRGDDVALGELGKLRVRRQAARAARNPRTGERVEISARNVVRFVPAKGLKAAV
jgi:DNA-binding protein HU-beta